MESDTVFSSMVFLAAGLMLTAMFMSVDRPRRIADALFVLACAIGIPAMSLWLFFGEGVLLRVLLLIHLCIWPFIVRGASIRLKKKNVYR